MSDESLHDSAGSHESTSDNSPADRVDPPVAALEDDHLKSHPAENNAPEAGEGGSPAADQPAEHEPSESTEKTPVLKTPIFHLKSHPAENNAPEAGEGGSPAADQPAEHEPSESTEKTPVLKTPILTWFRCRTTTHIGAINILAKDADAARERFKKAMGIRSTPHEITVSELSPDFVPADKDTEIDALIDKNDTPER